MPNYADKGLRTRLILPFATPAANRLKDFTKNMEMAAILYLAESNREKGESHILKKPDEKLVFITDACYPIWLIPYNGGTLVFDGLGITSHTLSYNTIPDIKIFNKDIQENKKTIEAYTATLARNIDYFKNFKSKEEETIEGLITTPDLIKDFMAYLPQIKETKKQFTTRAVLTSTIDDYEIQASIEKLSNLRKRTKKDIKNIDASMKLLNAITRERIKAIREEIRKTQEKHDKQIKKIKPKVTRKILQIQNKYQRKITRTSKRFKERLQRLHKNQVKLQKTLRHLRREGKRCEIRIQSSKRRKKKQTEIQWTLKLKRIKKKLPTLEKEIEHTIKKIEDVETAQKLELAHQKAECDMHIETANKPLGNLQASKKAEITMKQQEITTIEDTTAKITNQMYEMTKARKVTLEEFNALTMPRRKQAWTLVYAPFYLVRYEREDKKRYVVYPPSIVGDMGILTKMKGALGAAKMKALLQSRSKAMTTFLNQLVVLIEKNPMVEKEVTEAGIQDSVLQTKKLRISVKKGLKELEKENWISRNELQTLTKLLYIYS
jgi:hypothetical protein